MSDFYGYDQDSRLDKWRQKIAGRTNKVALKNNRTPVTKTGYNAANLNPANQSLPPKGPGDFDKQKRNIIPPGWKDAQLEAMQPPSLMDQLMQQLSQSYQPPATAGGGQGAQEAFQSYLTTLDQALQAKLGAIGNVRNQAQQGYQTSDSNLAGMFGATANNIASQGSQRFGDIASQHKEGLTQTRDSSLDRLAADRDKSAQTRAAMLKSLGIEESGASIDPGEETLNNAMTGITQRSDTALRGADQAGATNQAYNQSVVNSVNQQGAERRAALTQQLQAIQNQLGMAEADARTSHEQQKAQLQLQFKQAEAEAANATNPQDYQIWRDRQNLVYDIWNTLSQQEQQQEDIQPERVQGFDGLAQSLLNSGVDQNQAAQYIGQLTDVLGSEYMKGVHPDEGYDRASIIARRLMDNGVPSVIAGKLATEYSNLGSIPYITAQ